MERPTEIVADLDQYNWRKDSTKSSCTAHITSWQNQQYFKTSKVIIPTADKYRRTTYNKSTLKMFQNLKNSLTGTSLEKNKSVEVQYLMYKGSSFDGENRHVVTIRIVEDVSSRKTEALPEYIQNTKPESQKHFNEQAYRGSFKSSVSAKYDMKRILENLPKGYEFIGVGFERNDFDGGFGHSDNVVTEIEFEKIVKQQSREMKDARWQKKMQEIHRKIAEWKNKTK